MPDNRRRRKGNLGDSLDLVSRLSIPPLNHWFKLKDTITNPQVIVEVLSKFTKAYDRTDKFNAYKAIPSFQEYIPIDQTKVQIEQYSKTANKRWLYREYDEEDTALVFNSFLLEVPLSDIYEKVNFEYTESEESTQ